MAATAGGSSSSSEKKQRKILVAVDAREASSNALRWCLNNVVNPPSNTIVKDTLILLYVKPPPTTNTNIALLSLMEYEEKYKREVAEYVARKAKKICSDFNHNIAVETMMETGDAWLMICYAAEIRNVDLVVLGSHGYGSFKRVVHSSVSIHCAKHLKKCPILIVKLPKPDAAAGESSSSSEKKQRKILVAVDEGEESSSALRWCLKNVVNHPSNTNIKDTLILLYVKSPPTNKTPVSGSCGLISKNMNAVDKESEEKNIREVSEYAMGKAKQICNDFNHIAVETIMETGEAENVICEVAEDCNVDLVVLGSHGYGFFKRAIHGSVSVDCAKHLKCPVLIVKHPKSHATK